MHDTMPPSALLERGVRLEYLTLGWNVVGSIVVIGAAVSSRSVALAGFGLDSLIEIFASIVVVWHLKDVAGKQREQRALRLIGSAFFILATYVLIQAMYSLINGSEPERSWLAIWWLLATLLTMLLLAWGKHQTGKRLNNAVLMTEAHVTLVDACLAGAVLTGLGLDAFLGWWWADPLAGLVVVYYGLVEGRAAWRARP